MPSVMMSLSRAFPALLALWGITVALPARAQLAAHSPFLPQQGSATAPTTGAPLEFGGYLDTPTGERLFRLKDPARKSSEWVKLNEKSPSLGVVAKQFDEANDTLTIDYQGQSLTLAKKEAKILSAGNVPQVMPAPMPVAGTNVAPAVTQSVVVNPTQADEQRRLEAVAAEVARRRALREQATQQINQGVAPQIAPQVMPQQAMPQRNFQPNAQDRNNPQGGQRRGQGARQQR